MAARPLRTRDIARALGVHVNTIRLYEASGYLPAIPRDPNGYRHYVERTYAEAAVEFLERWAAGHILDTRREQVRIGRAARQLGVSVDMLRGWERNGLTCRATRPTSTAATGRPSSAGCA